MTEAKKKKKTDIGEVQLDGVQLAFEHVWVAEASIENGKKKYSGSFLMDPETEQGRKNIRKVQKAVDVVKIAEWGDADIRIKEGRECFISGDECMNGEGEVYAGFEGKMVLKAANPKRISIFDRDGETPLTEEDDKVISGAIVNAIVRVYSVTGKAKGGNGVFASLEGIQYRRAGESFGGGKKIAPGTFADLGDEDDEDEQPVKKQKKSTARDEDDEDERPVKKKKPAARNDDEDDEDEDERPVKKKKPVARDDDEDDEDERPVRKKKKASRDDDDDDDEDADDDI